MQFDRIRTDVGMLKAEECHNQCVTVGAVGGGGGGGEGGSGAVGRGR